ncbi:P2X purinoceptor 4-like, partial [Actinia tenebrosa]|uniref:P2X purinoceptor 4-like n=1 Tax=Actinia tenebrosa TaxID=6105 RepID=A0A6P8HFB6_ACTTE
PGLVFTFDMDDTSDETVLFGNFSLEETDTILEDTKPSETVSNQEENSTIGKEMEERKEESEKQEKESRVNVFKTDCDITGCTNKIPSCRELKKWEAEEDDDKAYEPQCLEKDDKDDLLKSSVNIFFSDFKHRKGKPLLDARNFTVLIKNSVQFPNFKISKRNIDSNADSKTLKNCMYDKKNSPLCPIFKLQTIVEDAGENFTQLAFEGGVMGIIINWQCDFDSLSYSCEPVYSFRRLDDAHAPIAGGYNFRHANYYVKNDTLHRTLFKSYGIRFVVTVIGQGGKFSVIPLFLNLGSGLALLGIATVLCDIVVLYVLRRKNFYREKKYQYVTENTEQETFFNKYGSTP